MVVTGGEYVIVRGCHVVWGMWSRGIVVCLIALALITPALQIRTLSLSQTVWVSIVGWGDWRYQNQFTWVMGLEVFLQERSGFGG